MSSSSTTIIKVRRLGTSRKEGHDYFKYELYNSSNNKNKTIASISGRFSQFLPFSQDVIKLFPWLSLSPLQQPLIPLATISEELLKERELKIQTMLYVIANDSMNNTKNNNNNNSSTKAESSSSSSSSSTSPLKYLLSRKEFIKSNEQQQVSRQEQSPSAIPTASEIDALIAPTSATTPSSSTIPTSSEIDALIAPGAPDTSRKNDNNSQFVFIPHQDNFDLSHFATHLVSWNAAVQFTENLEKEIESLRTNFQKLSKNIYQDLYEKTLDDFGESSKRVFVECDAFRDEQEDSGDFLDDCDENENDCKSFTSSSSSSPVSAKEQEEQEQEDLTPPPPRPVSSNPNANDDDDGDENQVAPTSTTTGKNKTTHFVDPNLANKKKKLEKEKPSSNNNNNNNQQQQHPLNQLVTIAAMYSQRGLDAIPNTVVDVASIILTFIDGAKGLAKRRRDMWLKMYQTLMEAHRLEIQHEEKINPSSSTSSSSKTTSPTNPKQQNQKQPPLPSNQGAKTHNINNNTILVSSASLIRGASSRHESEADILKEMIRSSSLDCENVYEESFKNFKALFEKMYHEDLMRNICESVTSKPSQVA